MLLARCGDPYAGGYDPYAWQGAQPDGAEVACYEYEMANSLPPTGNYD